MKRLILLTCFFCCCIAKGQSVFPSTGSSWNYTWAEHSGAYNGPKTLFYTGDTIISSVTYKKISGAWSYSCMCPNPIIGSSCCDYIFERNDSVFRAYPGSTPSLQLLYSFNQPIGDSILFTQGIPYKIVLDSLKTTFICNANRRVLYYTKFENGCTDTVRIIEGIGPVNDYLFSQGIGNCELGPGTFYFDCANITTCIYPSGSCIGVPYSVNEIKNPDFNVTYFQEKIFLNFVAPIRGQLFITDILGKIVLTRNFENETKVSLSLSDKKKGIYFVSVKTETGDCCKKIIIE